MEKSEPTIGFAQTQNLVEDTRRRSLSTAKL